jgi:hypothetical protein
MIGRRSKPICIGGLEERFGKISIFFQLSMGKENSLHPSLIKRCESELCHIAVIAVIAEDVNPCQFHFQYQNQVYLLEGWGPHKQIKVQLPVIGTWLL